jgi:hypothetical protein
MNSKMESRLVPGFEHLSLHDSLTVQSWLSTGGVVQSFLMRVIVLTALSISLCGCAAALVGGLLYKSTKSNEEKANFVTNLQKTNLDREKAHLKPLDWCSEAYKFDKGWAIENKECEQRVAAYEAGDKSALTP